MSLPRLNDYALRGKAALLPQQPPLLPNGDIPKMLPIGDKRGETLGVVYLPSPPTSNLYWRLVRGRLIKSKAARQYARMVQERVPVAPLGEALGVEVRWARKHRRGDLDNRLKVVLDALRGIVWLDDKQIVELHAYRVEGGDDTVSVLWWAAHPSGVGR